MTEMEIPAVSDGSRSTLADDALWTTVVTALNQVASGIADFNERSAHRERVIDRLHEENVGLRAGVREAVIAPVVTDLIRLYDGLRQQSERLRSGADRPVGLLFGSFADDVAQALERCGVEVVVVEPGDPFDPQLHTAVSVVDSPDPARHNTLSHVYSTAMRDSAGRRPRRPARVSVYRHRPEPVGTTSDLSTADEEA